MAAATLVGTDLDLDLEEGRTLLDRLLADGLPIAAALWNRDPVAEEWRLLFASPRVDEIGPRRVYRQIQKWLGRLKLTHVALGNVVVLTARDPLVMALRSIMRVPPGGVSHLRSNTVNGIYIDDAYVYLVR
jgi:hypothetical protein